MMKMVGRDIAENQIWEKRDIMVIKKFEFKSHEDKIANSASSPSFNQRQHLRCSNWFCLRGFREKGCFSLRSRAIGPLDFDVARRENVLRGARGGRSAWAWPGRLMGAQAGPVLVHCAPGSVLAQFLDPVRLGIFLSHQMNTVHYKIIFFSKKKFIKFK